MVGLSVKEVRIKHAFGSDEAKIDTIEKEEVVETVATAEAIAMAAEETQAVQEP